jgi:CRP-like cAMP-binding protein
MDSLRNHFDQFEPLSNGDWERIESYMKPLQLAKGDYFLREGQMSRRLGWITSGICRYAYSNEAGDECTKYFIREQQFASGADSFRTQQPSSESIQALTNVSMLVISHDAYHRLFDEIPVWGRLVQKVTEQAYAQKVRLISPMVVQDARTRYEAFLRTQPDVIQRVSLGLIASYLGMTQQSLSRLRRQLAVG